MGSVYHPVIEILLLPKLVYFYRVLAVEQRRDRDKIVIFLYDAEMGVVFSILRYLCSAMGFYGFFEFYVFLLFFRQWVRLLGERFFFRGVSGFRIRYE